MAPPLMRLGVAAIILLLAAPIGSGAFYDATPAWRTPVTDIATDDGRIIGGHGNGLIVALARSDGHILWARQPFTSSVTGLALHEGFVFASFADPPTLIALHVTTGLEAWRTAPASPPTALAADADLLYVGHKDGTVSALHHDSTHAWTQLLGAPALRLAPETTSSAGRIAFASGSSSGWFDASTTITTGPAAVAATWHAGHVYVAHGTTVSRHDATMLETAATELVYRPTALASETDLIVGDTAGLVHSLNADLVEVRPAMATYAAEVTALEVDDVALVGFESGWLSTLPLDTRPIGLILWPQEQKILPQTIVAKWAYSDPDAATGDILDYNLLMRTASDPPVDWQRVSAGTLPVDRVTRLKEVHIDVSGFPDGAAMEVKLELTDKDGRVGTDTLSQPFRLDLSPPTARAGISPAEGAVVTGIRPDVGVGHFDRGSGLNEAATIAWVDGSRDVKLQASTLASVFSPRFDLADGPHTWRLRIEDYAGNWRTMNGTFVVDLKAPAIEDASVDSAGRESLALSWTTDEPTTCQGTAKPGGRSFSTPEGTDHAAFLTELEHDTSYELHLRCTDVAKRTADHVMDARTQPRTADAPQPRLTIHTAPASPDGASGWYTQIPTLEASSDIPASVFWSLDGSPYQETIPTLAAGDHVVRAFAMSEAGEASTPWQLELRIDQTPPPATEITWSDQLRVLRWENVEDPESGIDRYDIEFLSQGSWNRAGTVAAPGARFEDVPSSATEVRLVAINGAGLTWTSQAFVVGTTEDQAFSTASVPEDRVGADERVRIRFHMVTQEQFQTALLRDEFGVERPFVDTVRLEGRLFEASAPAAVFPTGAHTAIIRVTEGAQQRELVAGTITITDATPHADPGEKPGSVDIVERRESPFPFILPALGLLVWLRRRH